jgi:hypothetical protein
MMTPWTGFFGLFLKAQVTRSPAQVEYRKAILPARPYYKPSILLENADRIGSNHPMVAGNGAGITRWCFAL